MEQKMSVDWKKSSGYRCKKKLWSEGRDHVRAGATGASAPAEIWPRVRRTRPQITLNFGEGPILVLMIVFDCKKVVIYSMIT